MAQTVLEGTAEFLAEMALDISSPNPQIEFGYKNDAQIKSAFKKEIFSPILYNWIWNSPNNEFGMRDLAYYVGYRINKGYYDNASDKAKAIKEMIELDYNDERALMAFVDASEYFDQPTEALRDLFEKSRPTVKRIIEIDAPTIPIDPATKILTVEFSEPMQNRISTDLGESGIAHFPKIEKAEFTEDQKHVKYHVDLKPNMEYEMVLHWNMRNEAGIPLVPYTLKFKTK